MTRAVAKYVGKPAETVEIKEVVQGWLGGHSIDIRPLRQGTAFGLYVNDDGLMLGLPFNQVVFPHGPIVGNFVVSLTRQDGSRGDGEELDMTDEELELVKNILKQWDMTYPEYRR